MANIKKKEKIVKNILKCIYRLNLEIDDEIFKINDREKLGKYYFNKILKEVKGANEELVKTVILKNFSYIVEKQELSCYEILLKGIRIYYMPKEKMKFVKEQFRKVFKMDLKKLNCTYNDKVKEIEDEIKQITKKIEKNKEEARITYKKIDEDLGKYIRREQEYLESKRFLEIQQMAIEFLYEDVTEKVERYFKEQNILKKEGPELLRNRNAIKYFLKQEALKLAKEENEEYGKMNPFIYYEIIINRERNIIEDPESLKYISITYIPILKDDKRGHYAHVRGCSYEKQTILEAREIKVMRQKDEERYCRFLEDIIKKYDVIEEIENMLSKEEIYNIREKTLIELIGQYKRMEYYGFVTGIPTQIEGMFNDWLIDLTNYCNFENLESFYDKTLKEKIQLIKQNEISIENPIIAYYFSFFNDLKRNRAAHGKIEYSLKDKSIKTVADELILDLYTLIYLSNDIYGNESQRIKRLIDEINDADDIYKERKILQMDLLGTRVFMGYPHIWKVEPMQFAYWLINPYYYERCKKFGYETKLNNVRNLFFENEIWEDFLKQIRDSINWGYNAADISKEFINVVKKIKRLDGFEEKNKKILTDIIREGEQLLKQIEVRMKSFK